MRRFNRKAIPALLFLCVPAAAGNAAAYTLQYASSGDVIRWEESCFQYSIHQDGVSGIEDADLHDAIRASFDAWEDVDCSYFYFVETDDAACDDIGYVQDTGNINLLVFREESWRTDADHDPNAIALATTSWDDLRGRLLDADIEFNAEYFTFGIDGAASKADLQNTATHEIGHLIGLDHSSDTTATMYAVAALGDTNKRTLAADDEEGLCALYPLEDDPDVCKEPHCGLDLTCAAGGCSTSGIAYYGMGSESGCSAAGPLGARDASTLSRMIIDILRWNPNP